MVNSDEDDAQRGVKKKTSVWAVWNGFMVPFEVPVEITKNQPKLPMRFDV